MYNYKVNFRYIAYFSFGLLLVSIIFLASFSAINGEVNFFNDVARDFLLLKELEEKKIVLIGPRTNVSGLFHGSIWTYVNYPMYLLANGDPVAIEWFWIFLSLIFLFTSFHIAQKFFGTLPAMWYTLLISLAFASHISGTFHSEVTFFLIPGFLFSMIGYIKSGKGNYLLLHFILTAILIQLNIGVGVPLAVLSIALVLALIYKRSSWKHMLYLSLMPVLLLNFIIFDIRHNFQMSKVFLKTMGNSPMLIPISFWLQDRINNTVSLQLINNGNQILLLTIFIIIMFFTFIEFRKNKKNKTIYFSFLFYYFGYMLLTFTNKGVILVHLVYFLIPLTTLWLVSFLSGRYKIVFLPIVLIVFTLNLNSLIGYIKDTQNNFMDKNINSWRGLSAVSEKIIKKQKNKEFGYFVYAPDAYAYQPRYAMIYNFKKSNSKAFEYTKKQTTYVIAAPPPPDNPYMGHEWWIKNMVKISRRPVHVEKLSNGFVIEEFKLNEEEQKIPFEETINLGLHFR